jgi:hypothetical protein
LLSAAAGGEEGIGECRNHALPLYADKARRRTIYPIPGKLPGENAMTKERQTRREAKKQPAMTLKEKRSAKRSKEGAKTSFLASGKPA